MKQQSETKRMNIVDHKTDSIQRVNILLAKRLVAQGTAHYTTKGRLKHALKDKVRMDNNQRAIERAEAILTEQGSTQTINTIKGATYGTEYAVTPIFRMMPKFSYIKVRGKIRIRPVGRELRHTGEEYRLI